MQNADGSSSNIIGIMDSGDGAAFVYRDAKHAFILPMPMPVIGYWLKRG